MNRIILIMLVMGFTSLSGLFSQVNEFTHPSIISFEKGTDPVKASSQSILSISDKHFKHGKKSLYWKWEKSGDSWLIKQPVLYSPVNPHHDNSVATFVFWVYAPQTYKDGKLIFSFYKEDVLCSWFEYKLGFQGWSGAWVAFDRDMQGNPQEGMDEMRIKVEGVSQGELYFDHIILSSFQDIRHHTADFQAPFINVGTTNHWLTLLDSWNKTFDLSLPAEVSEKQISDMRTIENRLTVIFTEKSKPLSLQQLTKKINAYQIRYHQDGSVTGLPVFFERYGETYERLGAPRYNLLYANEMGVIRLNKLMYDMAVSYKNAVNKKDKETIAAMYIDLTRHMLDQGFRAGSAMGTLHHLGYSMRLYYASAILMHEVLRDHQLNETVQQAMEWFSGSGEVKTAPSVPGMDVDAFNTTLSGRLASILMMHDSPEKVRYLQAFTRWVNNGLLFSDGTLGTFKVDGSMFHHRRNYPAYAVGGLEGAVNVAWMLHNTSFALEQTGRENLKNALLTMRYYCNLLTWPLSLSGRHPDGQGQLIPQHFARLALSGTPDGKLPVDADLAAAYLRLVHDSVTPEVRMLKKTRINAEKLPEGNRSFPYSSLLVHRRDNWMVTAMGHSRYCWATESYVGANLYGRYLNHGHLQIMATGNPISNFGSGFKQEGWDWNHFPGTTAAELPMKELRADIKNLDAESGYEELLLSDEAFAGPISIGNRNGAYAMKLHEHDKYNGSLRARKSFFFFDNRIIALGSNIRSALPENEVHTTLFQVYQPAEIKLVVLNRRKISAFPCHKTTSKKLTEISDGLNNHFFVKNGEVQLRRNVQHSFHEETDKPTENPFSLAYINHGKMAAADRYEYMVLIQPDANTLKAMRKSVANGSKSPYQVLQQDSMAHIVHDRATNTTAYVFFEAGSYQDDSRSVEVNIPAMVMTETLTDNQLRISIADPDLRFYEGPADEQYDENGKRIERSVYSHSWINNPSQPSVIELTLHGNWLLAEPSEYIRITSASADKTTFEVRCQHGLSREVMLKSK
ncbi:MAG: chondroitinase family polysaccharide lyase [Paludibacter sp.]|nr:chondroitinase family polysaccharide lyase [Paludibacter sp.]